MKINIAMIGVDGFLFSLGAVAMCLYGMAMLVGGAQRRRIQRRLNTKYRMIYRVITVPADQQYVLKGEGAAIEAGDYGWEAEPLFNDGLIYLHGLNPRWQVVWYAGFRAEQLQVIGPKPVSQYYRFPNWVDVKKIPHCDFPVKIFQFGKYQKEHFGFPVKIEPGWVQGEYIDTQTKK